MPIPKQKKMDVQNAGPGVRVPGVTADAETPDRRLE